MRGLRESFIASDFKMQQLMVEIVKLAALEGVERPAGR